MLRINFSEISFEGPQGSSKDLHNPSTFRHLANHIFAEIKSSEKKSGGPLILKFGIGAGGIIQICEKPEGGLFLEIL